MKITGIIAEYNPFHLGHQFHMEKAREQTGADYLVIVLSGDFVQRGAPAVFDKYSRTKMALLCGADLVLEMPSVFATGSAEDFAACGVALLDRLGTVDSLFFGSECGTVRPLSDAASILLNEPPEFSGTLKELLRHGHSFPSARGRALSAAMKREADPTMNDCKNEADFSSPNNILGIEYCKAILKQNSAVKPCTLLRLGDYHGPNLENSVPTEHSGIRFSSASAIRKSLKEQENRARSFSASDLTAHIPNCLRSFYETCSPVFSGDFSCMLNYALLQAFQNGIRLESFEGFSGELASRMEKYAYSGGSWEERIMQLKTRNYTYTRISRALLHLLLGITADLTQAMRTEAMLHMPVS
ncbi:nucleotidyltransferase family protein [Clostridium sp. AM58-1XD]|uniref:tRNA(Met) cytidine acetate ligase n=1 Tax=Clostridium sp. AM58-1XD TaxID=2292307 RepID=UPI00241D38C0|nr:nucleotidyltransferase family protein [Clostridium sp. AM58-1XD]